MQEGGALAADVDKGGLHAGQHAHDAAHVNVADKAARRCALDVQFLGHPVLNNRDTGFLRGDVDQNVFAHGTTMP